MNTPTHAGACVGVFISGGWRITITSFAQASDSACSAVGDCDCQVARQDIVPQLGRKVQGIRP
jgi:hypothetical protein